MTVVFLPLYAMELGAGVLMSGIIVTAKSLGAMLFNLPAGFIIGRWKALILMVIGLAGILASAMMRGLISTPILLLAASFLLGAFTTLWDLTRLTYIRNNVPIAIRGRVLSGMGGLFRLSRIIGPLAGGFLITLYGYRVIFFLQASLVLCAIILIAILLPRGKSVISESKSETLGYLKEHLIKNRRNITAAIIGIIGISILRVSRDFILPLWADHIGLTITALGMATSISAVVELTLFYPAGWIMDNMGRKWTLFPAIVIMTCAFFLVPLTSSFPGFLAIMILISLGNGIGSGINMTLGTDLAPSKAPGQFLGIWRFFSDGAMAAGPLMIGLISSRFSLGISPLFVGTLGLCTAAVLLKFMDRMKH
ncbi:MAG: MFS transporter [Spirochaetaceae bacterium]|nr:MFS transporter [Spirochaetaceae bacterium]